MIVVNHELAAFTADCASAVLLGKQGCVSLLGQPITGEPLPERELPILGRVLVLVVPRQRSRVRAGLAVVLFAILGPRAVVELAKRLILIALVAVLGGLGEIRTLTLLLARELLFR